MFTLVVCTLRQPGSTTPFVYDLECVMHVPRYIRQGSTLTCCSFVLVGTPSLSFVRCTSILGPFLGDFEGGVGVHVGGLYSTSTRMDNSFRLRSGVCNARS